MPSLRGAWERAVARSERDGHGRGSAAVALILLALCGIGFAGVAVAILVSGAENRSDLGAAAGGVLGALACVVLALRLTSDPGEDAGTLSFMTAKRWRALQVVAGAALLTPGLVEVSDGNADGWKMVALAVVVVAPPRVFSLSHGVPGPGCSGLGRNTDGVLADWQDFLQASRLP